MQNSQALEVLLNRKSPSSLIRADSACRSAGIEETLREERPGEPDSSQGIPQSAARQTGKEGSRTQSKEQAQGKSVFAPEPMTWAERGSRAIKLKWAKTCIGLKNLADDMRRRVQRERLATMPA